MAISNSVTRYGSITKGFHWLTALLILAIIPLGGIANDLPYDTSEQLSQKAFLFSIHKTLGVAVFFVALLRILWALSQVKPGALHPERRAETLLAEIVHWLLYGSLVIAPLTGWVHHAATEGFAPIWWPFGQNLPLIPKDAALAETLGGLHAVLVKVMIGSILLHVVGALKHQFIDKDATLRRMWFGKADVPDVTAHRSPAAAPLIAALVFIGVGGMTLVLGREEHAGPEIAALSAVDSSWAVQDGGTLAITVLQLGSEVKGEFSDWTADINFDPTTRTGDVTVTIAIGSLSLGSVTDQAMGADFFDVAQFPTATFNGPITPIDEETYASAGNLSIKGASVPVQFGFKLSQADDIWTMDGTVTVDRTDFYIGESMPDESNLGFAVVIEANLQAVQDAQ